MRHGPSPGPGGTFVALLSLVLGTACTDAGTGAPASIARDSAGIRIVETPSAEGVEQWRLSGEPALEIGVRDGDPAYQLHEVRDAARFPDGRIAVASGGSSDVRIYGADGRFLRALGGPGDGPGEFGGIAGVDVLPGDSVLALDGGQLRATVFTDEGEVARSVSLERSGFGSNVGIGRLGDGTYVVTSDGVARPTADESVVRPPQPLIRNGVDGRLLDTIVVAAGRELAYVEGGPVQSPFFGRTLAHAVGRDRVYVGMQERFEIEAYAPEGTLELLIRGPREDLTITDAHLTEFRERMRAIAPPDIPPEEIGPLLDDLLERRPMAETRPAHGALLVDAGGRLWVSDEPPAEDREPALWYVFRSDGALQALVDVPRQLRLLEAGDDYVLGRWRDELDVEYLRLYEIERAEGDGG